MDTYLASPLNYLASTPVYSNSVNLVTGVMNIDWVKRSILRRILELAGEDFRGTAALNLPIHNTNSVK
jgi:hypothetical protein